MRLTENQLRKLIRRKILKEEYINGEIIAVAADEALDDGVRTLANFVNWFRENYPDDCSGLSKADIRREASFFWKSAKKDRGPDRRMPGKNRRESFYDQPGWGRFD